MKYDCCIWDFNGTLLDDVMTGIDVSEYQGNIDWARVKSSGVEFAMLRLFSHVPDTPNYVVDAKLARNIEGAKANGIHIGGYFFSYARNVDDVRREAQMVVDLLKQYPATFDFPIVFDAETGDTKDGFDITSFAGDACEVFRSILEQNGYYVMVYANTSWFNSVINPSKVSGTALWQAHYLNAYKGYTPAQGKTVAASRPAINNNNGNVFMWQYTDKGTVSGIGTECVDMNISYRDYSAIIPAGGYNGYTVAAPEPEGGQQPPADSGHQHSYETKWNDTTHYEQCECEDIKENSTKAHYITFDYDESGHWRACECGYRTETERHHIIAGKCIYCGFEGEEKESERQETESDSDSADAFESDTVEEESESTPADEKDNRFSKLLDNIALFFERLFYYLNPFNWFK